jgi:hypothetical protein
MRVPRSSQLKNAAQSPRKPPALAGLIALRIQNPAHINKRQLPGTISLPLLPWFTRLDRCLLPDLKCAELGIWVGCLGSLSSKLRSRKTYAPRLSSHPPLREFRTTPAKAHIATKARVWNRIGAATATLFAHPSGGNTPSFGQLLRCHHLKEWATSIEFIVLQWFSTHIPAFATMCLERMAVHETLTCWRRMN